MMKGGYGQTNQLHDINFGALALTPHASHMEVVGVWVVYLYGSSMWESGCWYVGVSLSPSHHYSCIIGLSPVSI